MKRRLVALTLAVMVGMFGALAPVAAVPTTITHSSTLNIVPGNAVACPADNDSYFRTFDLAGDFSITGDFAVSSVDIGVETLAFGAQDITVNLYTLNGAFLFANLTPIGTATVNLTPAQVGTLVNIPVAGVAPAGSILVVEVFSPDFSTFGTPNFFIGSNADGQTAPSYLASAGCSAPEPTDTATLGFPNMHIVMEVNGDTQPPAAVFNQLCGRFATGAVTLPHAVNGCPPGTMLLTMPPAYPTTFCVNAYTSALAWYYGGPCPVSGGWRTHVLPANGPLYVCANPMTNKLRVIQASQQCGPSEIYGMIPDVI